MRWGGERGGEVGGAVRRGRGCIGWNQAWSPEENHA